MRLFGLGGVLLYDEFLHQRRHKAIVDEGAHGGIGHNVRGQFENSIRALPARTSPLSFKGRCALAGQVHFSLG
jgi:hypothetical protein